MIEKEISQISCDKSEFHRATSMYEQALQKSGYNVKLSFQQQPALRKEKKRNRKRNIIWFNPPYNEQVKTNIGKSFFHLLEKHFPPERRLHKICNKNVIKLSCSCTPNMATIISVHHKKLFLELDGKPKALPCNCRNKTQCPTSGKCREKCTVYKPA